MKDKPIYNDVIFWQINRLNDFLFLYSSVLLNGTKAIINIFSVELGLYHTSYNISLIPSYNALPVIKVTTNAILLISLATSPWNVPLFNFPLYYSPLWKLFALRMAIKKLYHLHRPRWPLPYYDNRPTRWKRAGNTAIESKVKFVSSLDTL